MLERVFEIPVEIFKNRKLVMNLAKNDLKSRFAGSYLGIVWAFVQPIITLLVYWFVFEKALNAGTQSTKSGISAPYILWLSAGLIPWFYFSEAFTSATNSLIEYNYLVKKVVFSISSLPVVKIISSLFTHAVLVVFMLVLFCAYGFYPSLATLQIIYYSFAMLCLALALSYATSAMVVFFRDLGQIVGIIMGVLIWATPIMWNIDAMTLSKPVMTLLKLNPMFYIVSGYRDTLINHGYFWNSPKQTIYFWAFTIVVFIISTTIFRKLKPHFADVL